MPALCTLREHLCACRAQHAATRYRTPPRGEGASSSTVGTAAVGANVTSFTLGGGVESAVELLCSRPSVDVAVQLRSSLEGASGWAASLPPPGGVPLRLSHKGSSATIFSCVADADGRVASAQHIERVREAGRRRAGQAARAASSSSLQKVLANRLL